MIDEFNCAIFHQATDGDVVGHREMLHELTQTNTAGVRIHADTEFGGQQENGQIFVDTAHPGGVDLDEIHGSRLKQLLEHHPILSVLTRGDGHGRDASTDFSVTENVIRARGLLDPGYVDVGEVAQPRDGGVDIPTLVGVDCNCDRTANCLTRDSTPADIVADI